ncbi:MAG: hypothetical protein NC095_11585 [Muribaculum sp.]|nr:hypothetical protein [Muribaculum sp.]
MNRYFSNRHIISLLVLLAFCVANPMFAETWDHIQNSGEYYYGVGIAETEEEADRAAMAFLVSSIATNLSSDFTQIDDVTDANGVLDHKTRVLSCVRTYSQTTLTNSERWPAEGKAPNITVRRYLRKSELSRVFENRIAKAKDMLEIADECLADRKIDMALQYYYWAYSLIRSVQFPNEVKDSDGRLLIDRIPLKIDKILSDIKVEFKGKDDEYTNLSFSYGGQPVSSLEFSYSDGRTLCQGLAKDGLGMMEMLPGYETDVYHLDIEYQYKSQSRGDAEMESVLNVITPKVFPKASHKVSVRNNLAAKGNVPAEKSVAADFKLPANDAVLSSAAGADDVRFKVINKIVDAISGRNYSDAASCFTPDGLQMFNRLTGYGKAKILDASDIKFHKGIGGCAVARGLKMSFSFDGKRKKTFVEDISFRFNADNKIDNVAFGLGKIAEDGIFNSRAQWSDDVREIIVSFMENYKTAYSLERIDYIRDIFSDDAVIIVGNVVKRNTLNSGNTDRMDISLNGQDVIKYNRYTKDSYIQNLSKCFNRNDFINLRFTNHQIQWLEKFSDKKIFAINIRQEYNSSTYADDGYLFLLVDMTDAGAPLIKVRTWQPNEVAVERLYNAGDFF